VHATLVLHIVVDGAKVVVVTVWNDQLALVVCWVALVVVAAIVFALNLLNNASSVRAAVSGVARRGWRAEDGNLNDSFL